MQVINITYDEKGMMNVASPFDVPTTLLALLEAQKIVLIQSVMSQPGPAEGTAQGNGTAEGEIIKASE